MATGAADDTQVVSTTRIFDFAKVADWEDRLEDLASHAEPERWTYVSVPGDHPLPVLDSYVRHTFVRVFEQQQVAEAHDLACFNTGLLTPGQEELFGVFSISENYNPELPVSPTNKKWFLKTWARSGDRILTSFSSLPGMASYWSDPAELVLDPSLHVEPNIDHILRDNLSRFPVELGGRVDGAGVPLDLAEQRSADDEEELEGPVEFGDEERAQMTSAPLATRNALDGAVKHSIRLARRSYRVAVPQYHRGRIQLLLPLYLRTPERADLALTLERHGDWYRAATVLYPDWAYRHARLLSRPNSEWLGGFKEGALV